MKKLILMILALSITSTGTSTHAFNNEKLTGQTLLAMGALGFTMAGKLWVNLYQTSSEECYEPRNQQIHYQNQLKKAGLYHFGIYASSAFAFAATIAGATLIHLNSKS